MIYIQFQNMRKLLFRLLKLLKAEISQAHHIIAMHRIALVQIILKYQEIRKRDSEIVDLHDIEQVLLAIVDQFVEATFRLLYVS